MKHAWLLFLLSLSVASCGTSKLRKDVKIENLPAPPGTIALSENQFFDKTEITNFSWREYLYWTRRTYGAHSEEYRRILPDTTVWVKLSGMYQKNEDFYLSHFAYNDYPVVGISYRQAVDFCNWRSNRVMEYMLIKRGVIEWHIDAPPDSVFTIEKYFKGAYYGIQPDPHFMLYPHYSLPDSATYRKAIVFADSLNAKNWRTCRRKDCNMNDYLERICPENRPETDYYPYSPDPTTEVDCFECRKEIITHLRGNVREMTDLEGVFFGASFVDSCSSVPDYILRSDLFLINSFTGFRAKCEYRKWK